MTPKTDHKASAGYLRSVQARLICRVESEGGGPVDEEGRLERARYVRKVERGPGEVIDEGYDPDNSPLGCPVIGASSTEVTSSCIAAPFWRNVIKSSKLGGKRRLLIAIPSQEWRSRKSNPC
jgi:hypothetical protein